MRINWKVFGIAFLSIAIIFGAGAAFLLSGLNGSIVKSNGDAPLPLPKEGIITAEDRLSLEKMTQKSARVNVLVAGTDGGRSDMMMVMSYDPIRKLTDIISIPRDTYHRMVGYDGAGMHKINAAYALKGENGGIERTRKEIESMLKIPIHYTVDLNYNAVRDVVDVLGGVEVEVKRVMKYDDPYCDPPLHIDFQPGKYVLNGKQAIEFLRWRKNNKGYGEGDIQRIERQHQFVKDAISKALGVKLPAVIQASFKNVKTDMPMDRMLYYAGTSIGMQQSNTRAYRIPGTTATFERLSYFVSNPLDTETMMLAIYNRQGTEEPVVGTINSLKQIGLEETKTPMPESYAGSSDTKATGKKTGSQNKKLKVKTTDPTSDSNNTKGKSSQDSTKTTETTPEIQPPPDPATTDPTDTGQLNDVSDPDNTVPAPEPSTPPASTTTTP